MSNSEAKMFDGSVKVKQGVEFYPQGELLGKIERLRVQRWIAHRKDHYAYDNKNVLPFPPYLIIEPTNVCNLQCPFCPRDLTEKSRGLGFMDMSIFKRIIDEAVANGAYGISLYMLGEPLLHKNIVDMINYAKQAGMPAVNLSTAATTNNLDKLLETELDDLILSIDGASKEMYERMRVGGTFEKTLDIATQFLEKKKAMGKEKPYVRVQIIRTKETETEIVDYVKKWLPLADSVYAHNLDGMVPWLGNVMMNDEEVKRKNAHRLPCTQLWKVINVFWNGDVSACCHDALGDMVLGNLKNSTLKELWNSPRAQDFRNRHIANDLEGTICKNCTEWDVW
jgi:radical SAM protein with 4Fe4S-binding SPASM domain